MSQPRSVSSRVEFLLVLLLVAIGIASGVAWARRNAAGTSAIEFEPVTAEGVVAPNPSFAPDDVVRLQLEALAQFRDEPQAMQQCFALASPANRAVTGPLARFTVMIMNPEYRPLVMHEDQLVGTPIVLGDKAVVLASVVGFDRELATYCFYLSKQAGPEYRGCWMTDSVIRVPKMMEPPSRTREADEPADESV
jgi:hypothetical protein